MENCGIVVQFTETNCYFQDLSSQKIVATGTKQNGLYYFISHDSISHTKASDMSFACHTVASFLPNKTVVGRQNKVVNNIEILHARLGHPSLSKMQHISGCAYQGLKQYNCGVCIHSKHHKLPFSMSTNRVEHCFDLIHIDLWGPYRVRALDGANYFLTLVDDHSRTTWTFLLHNKLQVYKTVVDFFYS